MPIFGVHLPASGAVPGAGRKREKGENLSPLLPVNNPE
jgi:hypothetical protein